MRNIPPALGARLASGVTTLCWCWRVSPRSAEALGFTDHDRDLVFDGTTFQAAAGLTATEVRDQLGLAVDNLEIEGALVSERLSEVALGAGDFDEAGIEVWRVDWTDPSLRVLVRKGSLGEVRRSGSTWDFPIRQRSSERTTCNERPLQKPSSASRPG